MKINPTYTSPDRGGIKGGVENNLHLYKKYLNYGYWK